MRNERARPQQCWKSCASESNIVALRFGDHGTKEMLGVVGWKVWPVSNFAQQHATISNNMQQGVQTDGTCNIQQCWELLANKWCCVRLHGALHPEMITRNSCNGTTTIFFMLSKKKYQKIKETFMHLPMFYDCSFGWRLRYVFQYGGDFS